MPNQLESDVRSEVAQTSQAQLRESLALNQQIIDSAQEGVIVYDQDLRYVVWNPYMERMTGLPAEQVLGKHPLEVFPFLTRHGVDKVQERALQGETGQSEEIQYHLESGKQGWSEGVWSPLRDSKGQIIGALGFVRDVTERVRTRHILQEFNERLQLLSRRLLTAQEQERRRLAIELHDEIGQVLTAVTLNLQSLLKDANAQQREQVHECMQVVQDAIQHVRELSLNLRPSLLDDLGLEPALRWFLDQQSQRAGFEFRLVCAVAKGEIPSDVETASFRIVQESVTNIVRHAQARCVEVSLVQEHGRLLVKVHDDGIGFDLPSAFERAAHGQSCGLLGMQERTELLGGRFSVESSPGHGTQLTVIFPLHE